MEEELRIAFNKVDKVFRNIKIRLEYRYLRENLGVSSIEARQLLAEKIWESWDGKKYCLTERSITSIIYPPKDGESEYGEL